MWISSKASGSEKCIFVNISLVELMSEKKTGRGPQVAFYWERKNLLSCTMVKKTEKKTRVNDVITREYTVNLHKRLIGG